MKVSVNLFSFFFLSLMCATAVFAQQQPRRSLAPGATAARMAEQTEAVIKHLELTGEVADTVRSVLIDRNEQIIALQAKMRGERGSRMGMREAMGTIDTKTEKTLATILSEEQMKAYKSFLLSQRERRRPRRGQ